MNKKGFTLVELLGVIIILTIIFIVTFPAVSNIVSVGEDTAYQRQINKILQATYDWSLQKPNLLPTRGHKYYVTLSELKKEGFVEDDIRDPKTRELFPNDLVVSITNVGGNYDYDYVDNGKYSKLGGNYLYTINTNAVEPSNKPTIILSGLTLTDGMYYSEINLGESFNDVSYTASKGVIDLTDQVIVNVFYNNKLVDSVNTNKAGIYDIYYTVVDSDGYSASVLRKLVVLDRVLPILTIPQNSTISTSVSEYDLLSGVSCTDNSGASCDITTSGTIEFGMAGKYVIEYKAKDPSGNTVNAKRVITIE